MTSGRKKPSEAPPAFSFAICLVFFAVGIYQVFASRHIWLGLVACAAGALW